MPKLVGVRERRHQPYWDTLCRVADTNAPSPTVASSTRLFATGTNLGLTNWTNMTVSGQFPSDNTYIVLAVRAWLHFVGTNALAMYVRTQVQLYLTLNVGDKPQFQAPAWYFPAGGGIWGWDSVTPIANNGVPQTESILKLAKPVPIPARQHFYVSADFYDIGSDSVRTNYINSSSSVDVREIKVFLDGIHTRDVL